MTHSTAKVWILKYVYISKWQTLSNNDVVIRRNDPVFNIEFSKVVGAERQGEKDDTWKRLMETVGDPSQQDWTYLTQINENLDTKADEINEVVTEKTKELNEVVAEKTKELNDDLTRRLGWIRDNQQAVVMFGVFLVAITILVANGRPYTKRRRMLLLG